MSKPFRKLLEEMTPKRRKRIEITTTLLKKDLALKELRQALQLTQEDLASSLHLNHAAISKFERQSDIYISTLRKILSVMGAELKIIAHFPEGDVVINQFDEIRGKESVLRIKDSIPFTPTSPR